MRRRGRRWGALLMLSAPASRSTPNDSVVVVVVVVVVVLVAVCMPLREGGEELDCIGLTV